MAAPSILSTQIVYVYIVTEVNFELETLQPQDERNIILGQR